MLPVGVVHSHITIQWVGKGSTSKMYQECQATNILFTNVSLQ